MTAQRETARRRQSISQHQPLPLRRSQVGIEAENKAAASGNNQITRGRIKQAKQPR